MRRPQRLIAATVLAAMSIALAGCSSGTFDPTDMMDWFDTKKKLPGDRRAVFPEGVPGVEQGVPKDLYRGARQQQDQPPVVEAAPPAPEPKARKSGTKSAARSVAPAAGPAEPDDVVPESDEGVAAAPPAAPAPAAIKRKRSITAPPPDPQPAQQQAQPRQAPPPPQQQSSSPFPAPLPSGGFAR